MGFQLAIINNQITLNLPMFKTPKLTYALLLVSSEELSVH